MAPFGPFLKPEEREKINKAQREGAKSGYSGKPSQSSYNKLTTPVSNSTTDKMVARDIKNYGNTVPPGSFSISKQGKEKIEPTPKPTPKPTDTAPTAPEKPLRSIEPSVEMRLPVGAERVDKMADKVRELRAMRARSQSRIMAQGGKPSTPMVVPSAKIEKPRTSGRNAMREDMDAFDIILNYLLENGHVDSLDEALYVMMEMDSEIIQEIVSEETEDSLRDRRQERGGSDGNQRYPSDRGVKKGAMSDEEKKMSREASKRAFDFVRGSIIAKHGKGAIMDTKKKEKKDED